ncbi:hypothetical protein MMC09_001112 [Bachmanniomyces sp. S44760]|nr:hypothetical protein [Bachmanniomyces sp. S44760]
MGSTADCGDGPASANAPNSRPPRQARPNFNLIYALPLPLQTYPLPSLIPHNPLSILSIALTYIVQLITRPRSHPAIRYQGYYSPDTCSVHITDPYAIRMLWERGFFGKGSLSRSEPNWWNREMGRRGLVPGDTSEELTRRRREERKAFKNERARKEREAIELKRIEEKRSVLNGDLKTNRDTVRAVVDTKSIDDEDINDQGGDVPISKEQTKNSRIVFESQKKPSSMTQSKSPAPQEHPNFPSPPSMITQQEHLQLSPQEAIFLSYGLDVLSILSPTTHNPIPPVDLFPLFHTHSIFPPSTTSPSSLRLSAIPPDSPFLLSYVVYHHFRSQGWVVRSGVKFGVDYLLYLRGPVFSHAEFAVIILPSYSDVYWINKENGKGQGKGKGKSKSWTWLHAVNRVQSQVRKSLVIVWAEVPAPMQEDEKESERKGEGVPAGAGDGDENVDVKKFLQRYKVREMVLKRWIPNRSRD